MLLGVDSHLRKLSFCTVHACTDSSNKALRESRLCINIAIRVVTPVAKGYAKSSHHCMAVYCEPWLPSERISTRYLQKPAAKSQSRSHVAARCNSYPNDANMRGASAAGPKRGTSVDEASTNKTAAVGGLPKSAWCMIPRDRRVRVGGCLVWPSSPHCSSG